MLGAKILETEVSRHISLGRNILNRVAKTIQQLQLGHQGIIIHDNPKFLNVDSIVEQIKIDIEKLETNKRITVFSVSSINLNDLNAFLSNLLKLEPKFIIGLGNSSTLEFVKYLIQRLNNPHLEWISIPTTPAHDGFASPFIFFDPDGKGEKYFGITRPPIAIIAEKNLLEPAPIRTLQSGFGDLLGKITSIWDWKLASRLRGIPISDFSALVAEESCNIVIRQLKVIEPHRPNFIDIVIKGLIIAGFLSGFSGNIRSSYGSAHKFSQALDAIEPGKTYRGERVALGSIMMASLQGQDWRFLRNTFQKIGLSVTAKELNLKQSTLIKALMSAINYPIQHHNDQLFYSILGEKGLTEDAAVRLAYRTGVIGNRPGLD